MCIYRLENKPNQDKNIDIFFSFKWDCYSGCVFFNYSTNHKYYTFLMTFFHALWLD